MYPTSLQERRRGKSGFAFVTSSMLLLILITWSAPARADVPADKTKKPSPTHAQKTKAPRPPTRRAPTDEPTRTLTSAPPTQTPSRTRTATRIPTETRTPTGVVTPTATPTGTPTETRTPTLRPEPSATNEPTAEPTLTAPLPFETMTPTETVVPAEITEAAVVESTAAVAPTVTSAPEATTPSTSLPSSTPTPTSTRPPFTLPTPFASVIAVNELLARPKSTDWNGDGMIDANDEWIELYNSGQSRVDLSGWHLSASDGRASTAYTFPPGTTIASRSYRVFYGSMTKVALGAAGGELRLLYPDGRVADVVRFPALGPDQSFERSSDRGRNWTVECIPTPHASNCVAGATLTSTFDLSFFAKHIADVSRIGSIDQAVLATNALLALILSLIAGLYGNLLNETVISRAARVRQILRRFNAISMHWRQAERWLQARVPSRFLFWVGTPIKLAALFFACGFILAFLDPSLDLREADGWMLVFGLALSIGLVSATIIAAQQLVLLRRGNRAVRRIRRCSIMLVLALTIFSKLAGFVPGVIFVGPTGYDENQDPAARARLDLTAIAAMVLLELAAWALASLVDTDAWFKTVALLTFAAAVQTLFIELLPFSSLHGRTLFESSRLAWFTLFALTALVLLQTMIHPEGSSIAAYLSPTMLIFALLVAVFAVISLIFSVYLRGIAASEPERSSRGG